MIKSQRIPYTICFHLHNKLNNKKHRNGGQVSGCKESNENMNDKMNGMGNVREP